MEDMVEDYIVEFESLYDQLFTSKAFKPYDLTAPKYIKSAVVSYIRKELTNAIDNLDPKGRMSISGIDLSKFSLLDKKENDQLKLFYFYLYGTPGEYVSISRENYAKMFGSKKERESYLGRFGTMFMMEMKKYQDMYSRVGKSRGWPSPSSIRHPFSGTGPSHIFEKVQDKVKGQFNIYIKKAGIMTTKS
jgi:hypothetical protein